ncbi:alpha/beta fold hydrolase [Cellulomonas soli]|uniref:Esterase n=1 Tax=Cellulomonas soli TaxID=931535 RepID=A0A512PAV8_9CELL|nr:alpha/beta hydrolase [Cellulomonas soli]NYI57413.1 pimeloyl-ACP methyl ester carboxylesterase [Cellulomonas soli]GEP68306.1 esterase [Cellulomonas soli]
MNLLLIPGFWLDAASWAGVVPALEAAGHRVRALTLPGLGSVDEDRAGIGLADHIAAVVAEIDAIGAEDGPVVLVGHSGGGAIAHGAVDARPDRVAHVVYVDSGPLGDGGVINDELPVVGDEIPLPDWSVFDEADLTDLDDALRAHFRAIAIPQPARVASDKQVLHDPRRFDVPVTVIACEFPTSTLRDLIAQGHPYVAELARVHDATLVDLPTGHWPQLTRPADLGAAIVAALA